MRHGVRSRAGNGTGRRLRRGVATVLILGIFSASGSPVFAQETTATQARIAAPSGPLRFSIAAQPLAMALAQFSRATGINIVSDGGISASVRSSGLSGSYTAEEGIAKLLAGTGMNYRFTGPRSLTLLRPGVDKGATGSVGADGSIVLDTVTIEGRIESAWGPVDGYVAKQNASATKTDTPIVETPQSISVVTADQISDQKATSIADALTYTPGVSMQSPAFSRMVDDVMMRGFNVATGNGGMLRDGMKYQSNVYDGGQEPYGLERVEVLRGASSMLYGQLTPGGIVNAISKRPMQTPLHEVNVEYGSYDRKQVSGDFSGPLNDDGTLLYRLTGLFRDADNWVEQTPDDKVYIAPALTWQPDAATSLTVLANYQHVNTRFATPLLYSDVSTGRIPRDLFLGEPEFDRYKGDVYSIGYDFRHEFDDGLKLHHSARYYASDVKWDYMQANLAPVMGSELYRRASLRYEKAYGVTSDTSLEKTFDLGASEHTVLAGFDYYRRGYDTHRYRGTGFVPLDIDDPVYSGYPDIDFGTDRGNDNKSDQIGFYLQDQIKFNDKWIVLLGGRYDWSDSTSLSYQSGKTTEQKDDALTGRAGLVYLFDNGIAPYVSISQSFAPQIGTDAVSGNAMQPNEGIQYEAGVRYQPEGSNLLLSAAVYDLSQTNVVSYDGSGNPYQIGKVRSRGIELEARAEFGNLGIIGAYAYTDAKILNSANDWEIDQQVDMVPYHTFSLWADYRMDDLGLEGLKIGGGLRYVGKTNMNDSEDILGSTEHVPGYLLADAMASYDFAAIDKKFEGTSLTVNVRNLFDKEYFTCAGSTGCRYGEPLTATATLSYKW
jgi:iron complex outermembrane receptor protein